MNIAILFVLSLAALRPQEERLDDTEYEKVAAVHVKAAEALEKSWRKDPADALKQAETLIKGVEADLLPRLSRLVETTIAVRATKGIDKGEIRERHAFFPYRLAGEIALAADDPRRAVAFYEKSPSSAAALAEAKKAVAAKETKVPTPPPVDPKPPVKPALDLKPFLDRGDFTGALEAAKGQGDEAAKLSQEIRREAARHQDSAIRTLAGVLPRLDQAAFRKNHLDPCLQSCSRLPADLESEELRWARRLDRWIEKRDPVEFEKLAVAATAFGPDFAILCDRAQDARLLEIEQLVASVTRAERTDRLRLLDQLGGAERAFAELAAARERPGLKERLASLKAKLPIDDKVLDEARLRPASIAEIRRLADELDRLWVSERRARLSLPDQKDLAVHLGLYRCQALFLDGRTIAEASQDLRLQEVFRGASELPADVSPKVTAVRNRINGK